MSNEEHQLPVLTTRQEQILSLLIETYIDTPEPISSKFLVEAFDLGFSSATVRNEMAVLEELGYISAPHTSAGRVPTENGYRYFVKRLLHNGDLAQTEQRYITQKFHSLPMGTEQWMKVAATIIARTAQTASLVTPPIAETNHFKHTELISIQGRLVLMVLVLDSGTVHQRMLNLTETIPQQRLSEIADRINALCAGLTANEVRLKQIQLPLLEREFTEVAADVIEVADNQQVRVIYRDGLSEIINAFPDQTGAQQAVRVFEENAFLNLILSDVLTPLRDSNAVRVVIAGEGRWDELSHLSIVVSRYGIPGQLSGTVGVVGPTRINYGRAISTVRYVSSLMTNMMTQTYKPSPDSDDEPASDTP